MVYFIDVYWRMRSNPLMQSHGWAMRLGDWLELGEVRQNYIGGYFEVRRYKFTVQAEPWTELALPFSMWILDHPESSNKVHKAARGHIAATSDLRELFVDFCLCSWVLDSPDQIPWLCWITDHHGSQRCTFPAHADMVSKANPTLQILA